MTKEELSKQIELIKKQYGEPEYELNNPVNESAKKIKELRLLFAKSKQDVIKTKKLAEQANELAASLPALSMTVSEELIRPEWLITFTEVQKKIVLQWAQNIKQTPGQIADSIGTTVAAVRTVMGLEAFKVLHRHLALGNMELLPLEASIALRTCLSSPEFNVRFNAAKIVLQSEGLLKSEKTANVSPDEKVLSPEEQEKMRDLAKRIRESQ